MSDRIVNMAAKDGTPISFVVKADPPTGQMKHVYFSPKRDYVVAFFHETKQPNAQQRSRLESIVGKYRADIFGQVGGNYWKKMFCWPEKLVEWEGKIGLVMPTYSGDFLFSSGERRGKEKQGKWFASAKLFRDVDSYERGDFRNYLRVCYKLAQAVRRLHAAGLAHSDLSYKNVLIDPKGGRACVIDVDGLVVPGKFAPDVIGTPDFIAPEVVATQSLPRERRKLPCRTTDLHALAVLIYMYLLHRHPLRGGRYFGDDVDNEEQLMMGLKPLYIEDPNDRSNRNLKREYGADYAGCLPWVDLDRLPAKKVCGPFLDALFVRTFVDGLNDPMKRPSAMEWENALVRTFDLVLPCSNPKCDQRFFVYGDTMPAVCPFCGTVYSHDVPILTFYSRATEKSPFKQDGVKMAVSDQTSLCRWHAEKGISPNEKLSDADKRRLGYFLRRGDAWCFKNERAKGMCICSKSGADAQTIKTPVAEGSTIELTEGMQLLLGDGLNARVAIVQMARAGRNS